MSLFKVEFSLARFGFFSRKSFGGFPFLLICHSHFHLRSILVSFMMLKGQTGEESGGHMQGEGRAATSVCLPGVVLNIDHWMVLPWLISPPPPQGHVEPTQVLWPRPDLTSGIYRCTCIILVLGWDFSPGRGKGKSSEGPICAVRLMSRYGNPGKDYGRRESKDTWKPSQGGHRANGRIFSSVQVGSRREPTEKHPDPEHPLAPGGRAKSSSGFHRPWLHWLLVIVWGKPAQADLQNSYFFLFKFYDLFLPNELFVDLNIYL